MNKTGTRCGCINCSAHNVNGVDEDRGKTHKEIWNRLANVTIMHGTPGQPKGKSS